MYLPILTVEEKILSPWIHKIEPFIPFEERDDIWLLFCRTLGDIPRNDQDEIQLNHLERVVESWMPSLRPWVPNRECELIWSHLWKYLKVSSRA